jgi:hypothetical protein
MTTTQIPDGIEFGLLPRAAYRGTWAAPTADERKIEPLARNDFRSWDVTRFIRHTYKQVGGTCAAQAPSYGVLFGRELAGLPLVVPNPYTLYGQHTSNIRVGSSLPENLECLANVGVCGDDFCPLANADINPRNWPTRWKDNAALHRVREWSELDGNARRVFDLIWTQGERGFPTIIGNSRAFGGPHSVIATWGRIDGSRLMLGGKNSWGESWSNCGIPGCWEFSEANFGDVADWGAWSYYAGTHEKGTA